MIQDGSMHLSVKTSIGLLVSDSAFGGHCLHIRLARLSVPILLGHVPLMFTHVMKREAMCYEVTMALPAFYRYPRLAYFVIYYVHSNS